MDAAAVVVVWMEERCTGIFRVQYLAAVITTPPQAGGFPEIRLESLGEGISTVSSQTIQLTNSTATGELRELTMRSSFSRWDQLLNAQQVTLG